MMDNENRTAGAVSQATARTATQATARTAQIARKTAETDVLVRLNLDGTGVNEIRTGVGFMDHMLTLFARHGRFDLTVICDGDTYVDDHHSTEDIGIVLGQAFAEALGDKAGIRRFGSVFVPMDEALVLAAVDISGRGQLHYDVELPIEFIGTFDTTLAKEFFIALAANGGFTLHIMGFKGENSHHIIEAASKAAAKALAEAVEIDPRRAGQVPSTKGTL